jgi:hypothetical protein
MAQSELAIGVAATCLALLLDHRCQQLRYNEWLGRGKPPIHSKAYVAPYPEDEGLGFCVPRSLSLQTSHPGCVGSLGLVQLVQRVPLHETAAGDVEI